MGELVVDTQTVMEEDAGVPIKEQRRKHSQADMGPSHAATPPAKIMTGGARQREEEPEGERSAASSSATHGGGDAPHIGGTQQSKTKKQ
eukprot:3608173-Heterocapsa_arctica.AAC.1